MKKVIKILILSIVLCLVYAFWRTPAEQKASDQLVVGTVAGYAPFVSMNQFGELEGFDVDVAQKLASSLNKKLVLQDLGSMGSLFTALELGKIDMIIWAMSITAERKTKVAMVHYVGELTETYPLLFWQTIPANVQGLADLAGQVVAVEPNSAQQAVLDNYPAIEQLGVEKVDDALLNLQYGKVAAALVDPAIGKKFQLRYPEIQILPVKLGAKDLVEGMGIVIDPKRADLIADTQSAVQGLKDSGEIEALANKWGID